MKRTYDSQNENDYDTVFNTSVNRNGFPVASRDQRLDVTKLFAVDQTEGIMDITKVRSSDESHVQNENDETGAQTRVFSDLSMSLEESLNEVANVSEMDTAMIIDDDVFDNSDENEAEKESVSSPVKEQAVEEAAPLVQPEVQVQAVVEPEPAIVIMDQESIADVSMSIVSDGDVASQEPIERRKFSKTAGWK